jgi:DNA-binding transcriptional LysR family regulator
MEAVYMDIKKYEVLLSIIRKGSYTKASEELKYTQPAITMIVKRLETEFGFPLLKRNNKGIWLTHEGEAILPFISKIVKENEYLQQKCDLIRGIESGRISIGVIPTIGNAWFSKIIAVFKKKYPNIDLEFMQLTQYNRIEKNLANGDIDVAFTAKQPYQSFTWFSLKKDPLYVVLPKGDSLLAYDKLKPQQLMEKEFIMCQAKKGGPEEVERYFQQQGVLLHPSFVSNSEYTIYNMVQERMGISILPQIAIETFQYGKESNFIEIRELDPPVFRDLGIAVQNDEAISPAMERLIQCSKEVISTMF